SAGVTSWMPTTITAASDTLTRICKMFADHQGQEEGAKIQGIHFEGPFFTEEHAGAENPKYMMDPDINEFNRWLEAYNGMLKTITIAPEIKGFKEYISEGVIKSKVVVLGHSSASLEAAVTSIEEGATTFTHTLNGMPDPSHHTPTIS